MAESRIGKTPRARDLGVPFDGLTGSQNSIADIAGIEVGAFEAIKDFDDGGAIRSGVSTLFPKGKNFDGGVVAGRFVLNGAGDMTGGSIIDEFGALHGPLALTGTLSLGTVQSALVQWMHQRTNEMKNSPARVLPVVMETWDGALNDGYRGDELRQSDIFSALDDAKNSDVAEGNVGGGVPMMAYQFKGGIGTSSRVCNCAGERFTVGVYLQANHGFRESLVVRGAPIGRQIRSLMPSEEMATEIQGAPGSICVVIATDAPLLAHQCTRLAKRGALGLARTGAICGTGSGDFFLAFTTANTVSIDNTGRQSLEFLPDPMLNPLFEGVIQATEEAIINALVAAETMQGHLGQTVHALPHDILMDLLRRHSITNG